MIRRWTDRLGTIKSCEVRVPAQKANAHGRPLKDVCNDPTARWATFQLSPDAKNGLATVSQTAGQHFVRTQNDR